MKVNGFIKYLFCIALILQNSIALCSSAPVESGDINKYIKEENQKTSQKTIKQNQTKKEEVSLLYVQKAEENKQAKENQNLAIKISDNDEEETTGLIDKFKNKNSKLLNVNLENSTDKVLSESTRRINAMYPEDEKILQNAYPGYRGANQLVIYSRGFGKTTGTNEFGKEAVVIDDTVVKLTGANSTIPHNGYVISGHGSAKKWISDNLKIGTKIEIEDKKIRAYTTIDSYRFYAKSKIEEVEDVLMSTKINDEFRNDKYVYYYLKKAKQQYKKSYKDASDASLNCAKEAIENAITAYHYTVPYIQGELKGTWIRPVEKNLAEVQATLDKIKETGINHVFLETYFHGMTIYPSQVMSNYGFIRQNPNYNFDVLQAYVNEAHKRKIKVHTWFESFYVGNKSPDLIPNSILATKPMWQNRTKQKANYEGYIPHPNEHNGYFLDPANPEVINFTLLLIKEIVTKYNVDGVNIDYVRYPNIAKENFNNQWGYTPYAREEFKRTFEIDPIEIETRGANWNNWCEYRSEKITDYVKKASIIVRGRNKIFSTVVFPDYKVSFKTKFQNWTEWTERNYVDAITPLILTSDETLAKSMLEEIKKKTNNNEVYPGLFAGFIESDPEDLLKQIHIIRKLKLNGVILFDWAHLKDNYLKVLKTSAFREQTY